MMDLHYSSSYRYLFVPSYQYLSTPIYSVLLDTLGNRGILYYFKLLEFSKTTEICNSKKQDIENTVSIHYADLKTLNNYLNFNILKKLIYIYKYFKEIKNYKKRIWGFLDSFSPDVILTPGETLSSLQCLYWASKNNKPAIIVQPSFITYSNKKTLTYILHFVKYTLINLIAKVFSGTTISSENVLFGTSFRNSFVFLFNKNMLKYYTENKHSRVIVMSNLYLEKYTRIEKKICLQENLKKRFALICIQNFLFMPHVVSVANAEKLNSIYCEIIKENSEIHFLVKIHPRQPNDYSFYSELFDKINACNYTLMVEEDLLSLFGKSFIHIASSSYTSLEAIFCGIPTINILQDALPLNDFLNGEIEFIANNVEECNKIIEHCFSKGFVKEFYTKRANYLKANYSESVSTVSSNIAKTIHNIIENEEK